MNSSGFRSRRLEETVLPGAGGGPWSHHSSLLAVRWPRRAVTPVWVWPRTHCQSHGLCWGVCQGCVRPALWPGGVGRGAGFGGLALSPPAAPLSARPVQLLPSVSATLPVSSPPRHSAAWPPPHFRSPLPDPPPSLSPSIGVYFRQETGKEDVLCFISTRH